MARSLTPTGVRRLTNRRDCAEAGDCAYARAMAIAAISLSPLGVGLSVSEYVAAAIRVLERQDRVRWQLDSMFTTLEGEPEDLFRVIREMQDAVFAAGAQRVGTVIKMDERRDRAGVTMEEKVAAVRTRLQPKP